MVKLTTKEDIALLVIIHNLGLRQTSYPGRSARLWLEFKDQSFRRQD